MASAAWINFDWFRLDERKWTIGRYCNRIGFLFFLLLSYRIKSFMEIDYLKLVAFKWFIIVIAQK